jgi:hypothetical protein
MAQERMNIGEIKIFLERFASYLVYHPNWQTEEVDVEIVQ